MVNSVRYLKELDNLRVEHKSLEGEIAGLMKQKIIDPLHMRNLKKRKLFVKESIEKLKEQLMDDLIA